MAKETDANVPISEKAAHWWALLHSGAATSADHQRFGKWVSRSPERIEAYLRTARLMRTLASPQVRWPDTPPETLIREAQAALRDDTPTGSANVIRYPKMAVAGSHEKGCPEIEKARVPQRAARSTKTAWLWGVAATIVLAVAASTWMLVAPAQEYSTRLGEQRYILLEDGSRVTLNTESRIEVELRKHRRLIRLQKGEALFQVAHDPSRPFDVQAGDAVLRAVGTQFDVDVQASQTTVVVVEGHVAVLPDGSGIPQRFEGRSGSDTAGNAAPASVTSMLQVPPGALVLSADERVVITPSGVGAAQHVTNLAMATSWAQRRLIFDHQPLSQVAREFNRYNRTRIIIDGDALGRQEISGVFQLDDPASFVSFLATVPGVEVHKADDGVHVIASRKH